MERAWWAGWKARLAVCLVAVLVGALLAGLLMGVTPPFLASRAATPSTGPSPEPSTPPAPPLHVPAGWTQVLPGLILSDFSEFNTLVQSAVRPGRIAACALPPRPWPVTAVPVLVLSDDGGRTWQQRPIHLAGSVWECDLQEDILNPDTYAVSLAHIIDGKSNGDDETLVTYNAGRTWQRAVLPASMEYSCAGLPRQLAMPSWIQADPCTVDPWDPNHLYAIIQTSPSTMSQGQGLYETRDGGSSWHWLHTWPTSLGLMEIHPTSTGLYVVDSQDPIGNEGVYRSTDGGVSWTRLPAKENTRAVTYFGLGGRLLTTAYPQLFQVDPATGVPTLLGDVPVTKEGNGSVGGVISAVAICEGAEPSLVVAGPYGTFVRSLPPLR
ncbi:MAG: WD40/YVTN/BNR-like repeat-containing protein [Ktedonobacterales bacterium]